MDGESGDEGNELVHVKRGESDGDWLARDWQSEPGKSTPETESYITRMIDLWSAGDG